MCGDYAGENAVKAKIPEFDTDQVRQIQATRGNDLAPFRRNRGVNPLELEDLVRKIMWHYVAVKKYNQY
jgi:succinate dehydrogenase/fumarate reductase flavoprotein subunit